MVVPDSQLTSTKANKKYLSFYSRPLVDRVQFVARVRGNASFRKEMGSVAHVVCLGLICSRSSYRHGSHLESSSSDALGDKTVPPPLQFESLNAPFRLRNTAEFLKEKQNQPTVSTPSRVFGSQATRASAHTFAIKALILAILIIIDYCHRS
jgi:hypothetical protein